MLVATEAPIKLQQLTGLRHLRHVDLDGPVRQEPQAGVGSHRFPLTDGIAALDRRQFKKKKKSNKAKC